MSDEPKTEAEIGDANLAALRRALAPKTLPIEVIAANRAALQRDHVPSPAPSELNRCVIIEDVILWREGEALSREIIEAGSNDAHDIAEGLADYNGRGVHIWEGTIERVERVNLDPVVHARGEFRRPTVGEMEAIYRGCSPFETFATEWAASRDAVQLVAQLSCLWVAACGGIDRTTDVNKGDAGWSPHFEKVKRLHARCDAMRVVLSELAKSHHPAAGDARRALERDNQMMMEDLK